MFSRRARLTRDSFSNLKEGRRLHAKHFLVVVPRHGRGYAAVVSKKTAALATKRHLLKRRILAALRTLALPGALVVFAKEGAPALSYADIRQELATLLA